MAIEVNVKKLIINKVESQEVFEYMKTNNLINEDEIYLIEGNECAVLYTAQELTDNQKAQVRTNINAASNDFVDAELASLKSQVLPTSLILADAITGDMYTIQIQNGQLVSFPVDE